MGTDAYGAAISDYGDRLTRIGEVPTSGDDGDTMGIVRGKDRYNAQYVALAPPDGSDPIVIEERHWGTFLDLVARSVGRAVSPVQIPAQVERMA